MATAATQGAFSTTIGRKIVMALTGLFLVTFLIAHLSGNLLLLKNDGGEAFNAYAEFMSTSPLIRIPEILLFVLFIMHIVYGLSLAAYNAAARPVGYKKIKASETSSFYSRFMTYSGVLILIFLLIHLWSFFVQHRFLDLGETETMYETAVKKFSNPIFSTGYLIAFVFLAFHLNHGFQSLFQTLGLQVNKKVGYRFKVAGVVFSVAICAGFAIIPLYFMLFH